jgi:hypothetical protein
MNIDTKITYNMNAINAINAVNAINAINAVNVTTQEANHNVLLKLFLYIILRYFI